MKLLVYNDILTQKYEWTMEKEIREGETRGMVKSLQNSCLNSLQQFKAKIVTISLVNYSVLLKCH